MAGDATQGIQTLPESMRTALATLATDTALEINSSYGSALTRSILLKQIRIYYGILDGTAGDAVITGFCRGDMSLAQIAAALSSALVDPKVLSQSDEFALRNGIYWQTVRLLQGQASALSTINETISIGGKKGIPVEKGIGMKMFAFNPAGSSFTTGAVIAGGYSLVGIFLEDD